MTEFDEAVAAAVRAIPTGRVLSYSQVALRAGRRINRYKVAKHFQLTIADGQFAWARREESIRREEQLDGIYVIRTSEPCQQLSAADSVRSYKRLALVEQAFRSLKGIDLLVRPIYMRMGILPEVAQGLQSAANLMTPPEQE